MAAIPLYVSNDMVVEVEGLTNYSGDFVNSAVVTATLLDKALREPVDGATWPITLEYVADSSGVYRGVLDDACELVPGTPYILAITAQSFDTKAYWELDAVAKIRKS